MLTVTYVILAGVAAALVYVVLRILGPPFLKFRGTRLITCPETQAPAAVEVDAAGAALTANLRLRDCSRWPERRDCGQACLRQIEAAPEDCLVRNILTRWYERKSCAYCGKPLGTIDWLEHRPALMSPQRVTKQWRDVPPETLPATLADHLPVCWNCHVAETFRRAHPELVTDRE